MGWNPILRALIVHNIPHILYGMSDTMTLNVRISGALRDHVARETTTGAYENVSEYVRDLIRRDKARAEAEALAAMRAELQVAFAAPEADYAELTAEDVFARAAARRKA